MFGDDAGAWSEDGGGASAAQQSEGVGVLVGGFVGRVEKDEIEGVDGRSVEEAGEEGGGGALVNGDAGVDFERGEVGAEGGEGGGGAFDQMDMGGAAAMGLDPDGAGAGVKVGKAGAGDGWAEDVEEGLAEAIGGGPGGFTFGGEKEPGAEGTGDHAHEVDGSGRRPGEPDGLARIQL